MKTINQKIRFPYLIMMIVLPSVLVLLFNIALRLYTEQNLRQEMTSLTQNINGFIRRELDTSLTSTDNTSVRTAIASKIEIINEALKISRFNSHINVYMFNQDGDLLVPRTGSDLAEVNLVSTLLPIVREDGIQKINRRYLVEGETIEFSSGPLKTRRLEIVYVADLSTRSAIFRALNLIIILIVAIGFGIGFVIIKSTSKGIVGPIKASSDYAKAIAGGHYDTIDYKTDTVEIQNLLNSLTDMMVQIKASDQKTTAFIQNINHELRTPLMSIQGYAEGIREDIFKDNRQSAQVIVDESIRLKHAVDEILMLSKLDSETTHYNPVDFNVTELIETIIDRYRGVALHDKMRIDFQNNHDYWLIADVGLFENAFGNLLSNAIKYGESKVSVDIMRDDKGLKIMVFNDGSGFETKDLPHVFDRFYKGKNGQFGLGLAIVKSAMNHIGGQVNATNTKKGACVTLSFDKTHLI